MVVPTKIEMPNQIKPNQRKEWNQFELEHNHVIFVIRNEWFDTLSLTKVYTVCILRITLKWSLLCVMVNDPKFMLKRWLMFENWVRLVDFDVFQNIYSFLIGENMSKAWQHFPNQNFNKIAQICVCIEEGNQNLASSQYEYDRPQSHWIFIENIYEIHNLNQTIVRIERTHTHTNPIISGRILWMRKHFWLFDLTIFMRVDEFT